MNREEASRQAFLDFYADYFVTRLQRPASVGRIAAALVLSRQPLSQAELRESLSLSEGSVSEGLRLLVAAGHVERAGEPRARPAYFQMRAESWPSDVLETLDNVRATYGNILRLEEHFAEFGGGGPSIELIERSKAMYEVLVAELPAVYERALEAGRGARPARQKEAG